MSMRLLLLGSAIVMGCLLCRPARAEEPRTSRYLGPVIGCLDTLMSEGTDRYGREHSPMFSSILDLKTHRIPENAPPLLPLQRKVDRAFPGGNLQHDLHTLLVMYHVSRLTGADRYQRAADAYMEFFLRRCASAGNGLFPCGEHVFWDFLKETIGGLPIHEDLGFVPAEFLDKLWAVHPQAVEKHIRSLERHFLPGDQWVWNRHAHVLEDRRPTKPAPFPRAGGFYLYQWIFLHTKTGDPEFLRLAKKTAAAGHGKPSSMMSLGLSALRANQLLGENSLPELDTNGRKALRLFLEDKSNDPRNGFISLFTVYERLEKGNPPDYRPDPNRTYGFWDLLFAGSGGYGFEGAERLATNCLCAHRMTGSREHLKFARDVCQYYLTHPRPKVDGIPPGKFAGLIAMALDLFDLTGEEKYLKYARTMADSAIDELYTGGLFRAATGAEYYEAGNGVGVLLMELLRLHLLDIGSDYQLPWNYDET